MSALPHAILIEGGSPDARMEKAMSLLKGHFADDPLAAEKLGKGIFEDLTTIEPDEGKDITVDMAIELIRMFKQKPFASTGRACLIPCGERMNEHAQNKLLKLLEEPAPGYMILILTGNAQLLLPTVRSRLMRYWLGYAAPEGAAPLDDLRQIAAAFIYGRGTLAEANMILSRYDGSREEATGFLGSFQLFLRNILAARASAELVADGGADGKWLREAGAKVGREHADRMRRCVLLVEKAISDIERGDRIRYALRGLALRVRSV